MLILKYLNLFTFFFYVAQPLEKAQFSHTEARLIKQEPILLPFLGVYLPGKNQNDQLITSKSLR